jgi:glycosyltransferase involved in cell wall biosynthesis
MRRVKGADLLLKAMIDLPDDIHAVFVGEVRDEEIEELKQRPELRHRVHFTGYQKNAANLIKQFDINVAPSRGREGLTKTVIEAMAHGVPNIVSDAGGLPELVINEESGLIFPARDPVALASTIESLNKNDQLRRSMGRKGKTRIFELFNIRKTITETRNLYESSL